MLNMLERALSAMEWVLRQVILWIYVAVVVIVTFQVLNRFWLHWPIVWLSDLAIICFIWLGFLTAALAVRHHGHFRMALMLDLSGRGVARRVLEFFSLVVGACVFGVMAWTGWEMAIRGLREIAPGLRVPMTWAYASVPLAACVALLYLLEAAVMIARGRGPLQHGSEPGEDVG